MSYSNFIFSFVLGLSIIPNFAQGASEWHGSRSPAIDKIQPINIETLSRLNSEILDIMQFEGRVLNTLPKQRANFGKRLDTQNLEAKIEKTLKNIKSKLDRVESGSNLAATSVLRKNLNTAEHIFETKIKSTSVSSK